MIDKWDLDFLELAEWWGRKKSKDPSTKVGAVITYNREVVSLGYNGLPQHVEDSPDRLNNRETKLQLTVHAEQNAMIFARRDLKNCTLYTWPFMPCSRCAGEIIQHGINRVVAPLNDNPRWIDSFKLTEQLFAEAGIVLELIDVEMVERFLRSRDWSYVD